MLLLPIVERKNRYYTGTHISERVFRHILKEFSRDTTASETADRTKISRPTINKIYHFLRLRIYSLAEEDAEEIFTDDTEADESYFGPRRVRGKRGRGALGKIPVFGILKRGGKVYTRVVENCSRDQLLPILKGKVLTGTRVYTDGWKSYDSLVYNYDHYRVYHSENEFARGKNHINGIESFWSYAKRRLRRFNGIHRRHFLLHLKECEWRFNHRRDDIYGILIFELWRDPISNGKYDKNKG
jgi:transposase